MNEARLILMRWLPAVACLCACGADPAATSPCGPGEGVVASVHDGDTVTLQSGVKLRYLLVDTPEITGCDPSSDSSDCSFKVSTSDPGVCCYGAEATQLNSDLVLGKTVQLEYDQQCTDRFQRTLAYVHVDGRMVNEILVERGYGCALVIPPNTLYADQIRAAEASAKQALAGVWGLCQ